MNQGQIYSHRHWQRLRWQLSWGIAAAVLPFVIRALLEWAGIGRQFIELGLNSSLNAFWGGGIAILAGILLIRNVGRYPGIEKAAAIIPSFSISFGVLIAVFLMLRLDYSRWMLAGAYLCAVVIFYLGYAQVFGQRQLVVGVIPLKDAPQSLLAVHGVDWRVLDEHDGTLPKVDAIAVDLRADLPDVWDKRIADYALAGLPVYHAKHLLESLTGRVELEHLSETSFGTLSPSSTYMVPKRVVDCIVSVVALILLSPFLVVVGILIRADTPGPAIFRQQRIGYRGHPFVVYKFRTMTCSPAKGAAKYDAITREGDDRVTRLGRILRKTRIDELPQLVNVVRGQMSLIGPRPEATVLSQWYEAEIPFYRYRHIVRPGITGWAQVMQGHVADVEQVRSKLHYDFYYIKNFSLWIDSLIFFRTVATMITGFGAK